MLISHHMDSAAPFSLLLIGEPTLWRRLKMGDKAALDQRIGLRYAMAPQSCCQDRMETQLRCVTITRAEPRTCSNSCEMRTRVVTPWSP